MYQDDEDILERLTVSNGVPQYIDPSGTKSQHAGESKKQINTEPEEHPGHEEYYENLLKLAAGKKINAIIIDPSAASFIETVKRHGEFKVIKADNDVLKGINYVCNALKEEKIFFFPCCESTVREFSVYRWDDGVKRDAPKKENDHAMDDIRYFVATVLYKQDTNSLVSVAVERM